MPKLFIGLLALSFAVPTLAVEVGDGATAVGFNGALKGSIPGEAFNKALTKVWLGDKPVQADLKKALLGG